MAANTSVPPTFSLFAYLDDQGTPHHTVKSTFLAFCDRIWKSAGLEHVHGHSFRIGGAVELLLAGVTPEVVAAVAYDSGQILRLKRTLDDYQKANNIPNSLINAFKIFQVNEDQRALVQQEVAAKGFIPQELVANKVNWFYTNLGIDDTYFRNDSPAVICDHIIALFGTKMLAYTKHDPSKLFIDLEKIDENGNGATFIHTSPPGITTTEGPGATCESRIDTLFLDNSKPNNAYRLETFRSAGSISATASQQLRCYFVNKCDTEGRTNINSVSDKGFLEKASEKRYERALFAPFVEQRYGPVMEVFEVEGSRERRLVIGYKMGGTTTLFSALSKLYHLYSLYFARKYVEQFSNGVTIISLYLNPVPNSNAPPIEHSIFQVMKEASLLFCLPENPFFLPKAPGMHAVQEAMYALRPCDPAHAEVLNNIKRRFREETFMRAGYSYSFGAGRSASVFSYHMGAFTLFADSTSLCQLCHGPPSLINAFYIQPLSDEELYDKICRTVPNKHSLQPTKVTLSFPLDPGFLPEVEYPKKPFTMFFVIGNEFRGFHIRFRDVARGGIRIVMIRNKEMHSINQRMLFDENYNLASTQLLKNKDIPEGGAKGTILPSIGATPRLCFEKYVDAIVDLLIPGKTPGIKETLVDLYEKPELLFFGPDGTADMMDWAALHARDRGAETWWKSFTTGKSAETLGGVPHDTYGMTSLSIRQYVLGIYKQLGLKEKEITKVQTGGPDGDLGSNEILLSSDKTVAIIDGSGVLADPTGLDREELIPRMGTLVKVEEQDVKLPSGEIVLDGTDFRNGAHLRFKADLFVPCGGRPEAVNISNMAALFDSEGKPHFKYIVEGANLFLTQQARLFLEKHSSTNKGGVTSSSLEVLAGLALSTEEYVDLMIFKDGKPSEFYQSYVKDIQAKITENAAAEFHCLRLLKRLPEAYQRALFSSWVALHFIYKYGVNASSVDFFHFARDLSK
ncbi:hypothetical protein BT96DRAFT_967873 [Gymnopus androsaceus JB14]|uniref:Glutamate/phenylalanine/leucine/valine/L-tryptophan dehydrogenase C-terminal domain-containing protein n=1 Tax=Gymnopus androsaceus JB14 TaxID=1447944 RepID=A0A6A4GVY0_9AGAR|nr:hypothetical protein BT96DRAFT_967873 [Gymnopus androsaceus JB14]